MSWRVAKSLDVLLHQVNECWPGRDKSSDGSIGDASHSARSSDHNPDDDGVVKARDITHDPAHGLDARKLAEALVASRDERIKYVISNAEICSGTGASQPAWKWRPYTGTNAHRHHVHISVKKDKAHYDDQKSWVFGDSAIEPKHEPDVDFSGMTTHPIAIPSTDPPAEPQTAHNPDLRLRMAKAIMDLEARRDGHGHLMVYRLPANDGGGRYEVAGINETYDKPVCDQLVALVEAKKFDEAENVAEEYIASNTDGAAKLTTVPSVESYLRDCIFNRGPAGAVKILQMALGFEGKQVDGHFGDLSKPRMAEAEKMPQDLLTTLRTARERYEREHVGYRANLWRGLVNRWDKALVIARTFPDAAPEKGLTS